MIAIVAIDALEHELVEEFDKPNMKQLMYGKTDITEFSQPRTIVLWSSFMTGLNKEDEVLALGDKDMWHVSWPIEETFFSGFENPLILDLPGYNYDMSVHDLSRKLLKGYFETEDEEEKKKIKKSYNHEAFEHHKKIKKQYFDGLDAGHDLVLGYFSVADVVGHLSFGNKTMMKIIYDDLDDIIAKTREKADLVLVVSDHGMKALGMFGDHSEYGFWSASWETSLKKPKITDFRKKIEELK